MKAEAVIVAAGSSRRAGCNKLTHKIGGKMVLEYSLDVFQNSPLVKTIILVASSGSLDYFQRYFAKKFSKLKAVVKGGRRRSESVFCGIKRLDEDTKAVFIHDGARPFVPPSLIRALFSALKKNKAVVPVLKVRDTIKICRRGRVMKTLGGRESMFLVHTPQAFRKDVLGEAYKAGPGRILAYDDAFLIEKKRLAAVKTVESSIFNFKITFPSDLVLAEIIAERYVQGRIRF